MLNAEILDRKDVCAVCGSVLETAYKTDFDDYWISAIDVENKVTGKREVKDLKCCSRCGLVYAK